jgi:hypothetical protein
VAIHYQPNGSLGKQVSLDPTAFSLPTQLDLPGAQQDSSKRGKSRELYPLFPASHRLRGPPLPEEIPPPSIEIRRRCHPNQPWPSSPPALVITMVGQEGCARGRHWDGGRSSLRTGAERRLPFLGIKRTGPQVGAGSFIRPVQDGFSASQPARQPVSRHRHWPE